MNNQSELAQEQMHDNTTAGPMSIKARLLHAFVGGVVGVVSFLPIFMLCFYMAVFIGYNLSKNADDFLLGYACLIPSMLLSLLGGVIGGGIGYRKKHEYRGAALGGLLGPIATLLPLTISILKSWAGY